MVATLCQLPSACPHNTVPSSAPLAQVCEAYEARTGQVPAPCPRAIKTAAAQAV